MRSTATANTSSGASFGQDNTRDTACELRNGGGFIGGAADRRTIPDGQFVKRTLSMNGGAQVPAGGGEVSLWCKAQGAFETVDCPDDDHPPRRLLLSRHAPMRRRDGGSVVVSTPAPSGQGVRRGILGGRCRRRTLTWFGRASPTKTRKTFGSDGCDPRHRVARPRRTFPDAGVYRGQAGFRQLVARSMRRSPSRRVRAAGIRSMPGRRWWCRSVDGDGRLSGATFVVAVRRGSSWSREG